MIKSQIHRAQKVRVIRQKVKTSQLSAMSLAGIDEG